MSISRISEPIIAIITDNENDRLALEKALKGSRYVVTAEVSEDACACLCCCEDIQTISYYVERHIPVLLITDDPSGVKMAEGLKMGAIDFVSSDIERSALINRLDNNVYFDRDKARRDGNYRRLIESTSVMLFDCSAEGDELNCHLCLQPGSRSWVDSKSDCSFIHPDSRSEFSALLSGLSQQPCFGTIEFQCDRIADDGQWRWAKAICRSITDENGVVTNIVGQVVDIDKEKRLQTDIDVLKITAETDPLTGLFNRAGLEQRVGAVLESYDGKKTCALLVVDIDELKIINDTFGHDEGDRAIVILAETMKEQFSTGVVSRIGGDEFVVFMEDVASDLHLRNEVTALFQRLEALHEKNQWPYRIKCSVGGAIYEGGDYKSLFRKADRALYHVKRSGKSNFAMFLSNTGDELHDYVVEGAHAPSLRQSEWYNRDEIQRILLAISVLYPLVISVNLTQNHYYMLEYESFTTQTCPSSGSFDQLIEYGSMSFMQEDRQSFVDTFSRLNQIEAFERGVRRLSHEGMQRGDDGIYRRIHTEVVYCGKDENGDIHQVTISRPSDKE